MSEESLVSAEGVSSTLYPHVEFERDLSVFDAATVFRVLADGNEITQCSDIVKAMTVAFVMHWIFNIKYPKEFFGTLSLFDTYVFRKNSVRVPQKVRSLINKLS